MINFGTRHISGRFCPLYPSDEVSFTLRNTVACCLVLKRDILLAWGCKREYIIYWNHWAKFQNETGLVNFVCISFELGVNIVVYVTLIVQMRTGCTFLQPTLSTNCCSTKSHHKSADQSYGLRKMMPPFLLIHQSMSIFRSSWILRLPSTVCLLIRSDNYI